MSPSRILPVLFSMLSIPALVACGGDSSPADGGADGGVDLGGDDAGPDMPLVPSTLYGPCTSNEECPGADGTPGGGVCRQSSDGWTMGYCTVPCMGPTDDVPCNDAIVNYCADIDGDGVFFCERKCLNGVDCMRDNYTCTGFFSPDGTTGICVGVCTTDADCGVGGTCGAGGRCASRHVSGGMANGSACSSGGTCASQGCVLGNERGTDGLPWPNLAGLGFLGGYCTQTCALPAGYNSSTFFSGPDLPQGACDASEVCFPMDFPASIFISESALTAGSYSFLPPRTARGDGGFCAPTCTSDVECRPGYECYGLGHFTAGVCVPGCTRKACPSGTVCLQDTSHNHYVCVPGSAPPPDAGTDSGPTTTDAGTMDAGAMDAGTTSVDAGGD